MEEHPIKLLDFLNRLTRKCEDISMWIKVGEHGGTFRVLKASEKNRVLSLLDYRFYISGDVPSNGFPLGTKDWKIIEVGKLRKTLGQGLVVTIEINH